MADHVGERGGKTLGVLGRRPAIGAGGGLARIQAHQPLGHRHGGLDAVDQRHGHAIADLVGEAGERRAGQDDDVGAVVGDRALARSTSTASFSSCTSSIERKLSSSMRMAAQRPDRPCQATISANHGSSALAKLTMAKVRPSVQATQHRGLRHADDGKVEQLARAAQAGIAEGGDRWRRRTCRAARPASRASTARRSRPRRAWRCRARRAARSSGSSSVPGLATSLPDGDQPVGDAGRGVGIGDQDLHAASYWIGVRPARCQRALATCWARGHDGVAVGQGEAAARQHHAAVDDHGIDVVPGGTVHQHAVAVDQRRQRRRAIVEQDDVGASCRPRASPLCRPCRSRRRPRACPSRARCGRRARCPGG